MILNRRTTAALILLTLISATGLVAGPILTGPITVVDPPSSLLPGMLSSDSNAFLISEARRFRVNQPLLAGLWGVSLGSLVDVWMLHTDPVGPSSRYTGSIEFSKNILHLDTTLATLKASDPYVQGLTGTAYEQNRSDRGLGPVDHISYASNLLTFNVPTIQGVDEARIVTEAETPEPFTMGLMGLGCGAIGLMSRRRSRKAA